MYIYTHTHNGKLFSLKRKEILTFAATWMNFEGFMLNEMSDRERQTPYLPTYMRNLTKLNS